MSLEFFIRRVVFTVFTKNMCVCYLIIVVIAKYTLSIFVWIIIVNSFLI